jgi:hypothetical protein
MPLLRLRSRDRNSGSARKHTVVGVGNNFSRSVIISPETGKREYDLCHISEVTFVISSICEIWNNQGDLARSCHFPTGMQ